MIPREGNQPLPLVYPLRQKTSGKKETHPRIPGRMHESACETQCIFAGIGLFTISGRDGDITLGTAHKEEHHGYDTWYSSWQYR